jgi:hypothetical protein
LVMRRAKKQVLSGLEGPVVFAFSANTLNVNICCLLGSYRRALERRSSPLRG